MITNYSIKLIKSKNSLNVVYIYKYNIITLILLFSFNLINYGITSINIPHSVMYFFRQTVSIIYKYIFFRIFKLQ